MRDIEDRDRIAKMLKRRPVLAPVEPKAPGEYLDELRDEIALEALTDAPVAHKRSQQLWESE